LTAVDTTTQTTFDWIDNQLKKYHETVIILDNEIRKYLEWMADNAYSQATQKNYKRVLGHFLSFVRSRRYLLDDIFTYETMMHFKKIKGISAVHVITGFTRYLYDKRKIATPMPMQKSPPQLPIIYEDYLLYYKKSRHASDIAVNRIRRVLLAFNGYCQRNDIELRSLRIEHVDAFQKAFFNDFKATTCGVYRSYLRKFLRYLYHERRILTADLSPMVVGRREYTYAKPPKFLRLAEVRQLLSSLNTSSVSGIRTYATVHLAYTMGLRPQEISLIRLDDICFTRQVLRVCVRKGDNPLELPIPEHTIKAVAAYIIGGRPKSDHRRLFLTLHPPYRPTTANTIGQHITNAMRKIGLNATAYWLRHTYAQNLLEAGASVFEIKEMLGHDKIESTRKYLRVHPKQMRQVLFDETV
jgi:integrase/recombinase XerD